MALWLGNEEVDGDMRWRWMKGREGVRISCLFSVGWGLGWICLHNCGVGRRDALAEAGLSLAPCPLPLLSLIIALLAHYAGAMFS